MKTQLNQRRGATLVLITILLVVIMAMLAFAVDIGYQQAAKTQLQRTADAAAMAACWELMQADQLGAPAADQDQRTRDEAAEFAALNKVLLQSPGLEVEDVDIGYLNDPSDRNEPMKYDDPSRYNAVRVRVRRTEDKNGSVALFFGRVLGTNSVDLQAEATAAFFKQIRGFRQPDSGQRLGILPIALDQDTWDSMLLGAADDDWNWNPETKTVSSGADGMLEMNLFPQGIGLPGNRGTVDIGSNNNSTADIARQVLEGISDDDLSYHGGKLEFDQDGKLYLNGDTGISAGIKDELEAVVGEPKLIPIFSYVEGPGNNAMYTIVDFVGVRILEVKLTGPMSQKRVIIQPAKYVAEETIGEDDGNVKGQYVYSPVWLVR